MALIILSAVSGTGKSTIAQGLTRRAPAWRISVSHTTRRPRTGETEGVSYHFVGTEEFERMIDAGVFAEWAQYVDNYYGTSRDKVEEAIAVGNDLIFDIELEGARQLKHAYPEAQSIFILPPSFEELERRLYGRGTDTAEKIIRRLRRGLVELSHIDEFDHVIVNESIEKSMDLITGIRDGKTVNMGNNGTLVEKLLQGMKASLDSSETESVS